MKINDFINKELKEIESNYNVTTYFCHVSEYFELVKDYYTNPNQNHLINKFSKASASIHFMYKVNKINIVVFKDALEPCIKSGLSDDKLIYMYNNIIDHEVGHLKHLIANKDEFLALSLLQKQIMRKKQNFSSSDEYYNWYMELPLEKEANRLMNLDKDLEIDICNKTVFAARVSKIDDILEDYIPLFLEELTNYEKLRWSDLNYKKDLTEFMKEVFFSYSISSKTMKLIIAIDNRKYNKLKTKIDPDFIKSTIIICSLIVSKYKELVNNEINETDIFQIYMDYLLQHKFFDKVLAKL